MRRYSCTPECSKRGLQALREILAQVPSADAQSCEAQLRGRPRACAPGSGGEGARALLQMWPSAERGGQPEPRGRQGAQSAGALVLLLSCISTGIEGWHAAMKLALRHVGRRCVRRRCIFPLLAAEARRHQVRLY